jgi:hypothetical protein
MKDLNKNSIVVKILANENISLVVQEGLPTASFDLKNRIVRVPNYMFDDDDFTTMVLAHEVGHCLYTPYNGWFDFLKQVEKDTSLTDQQKNAAKSALNILEDVRIDKFMQKRYSGLVKYYKRSCRWIVDNDFFKIKAKNKNLTGMSFLNRLCVWAKCDSRSSLHAYGVKFSAEEQSYVDEIFAAETFEEVQRLALEVIKRFPLNDDVDGLDEEMEEEEGDNQKGEGQEGEGLAPGRYNVHDENMDKDGKGDGKDYDNVTAGGLNAVNQSLYDLWEQSVSPKANVAVSNSYQNKSGTKILNEMKEFVTADFATGRRTPVTLDKVSELSKEYNQYVNLFATKFNQRKRARQLVNNFERDTGRVDPLKLFKYKYDDNIFTKNVIENYQKNHGFMFLIDCSSSMSDVFKSLTLQLFAFYKICDRIDVPFVAYGYTDEYYFTRDSMKKPQETNFGSHLKYYKFFEKGDSKKEIFMNIAKMIAGDVSMGGTPTSDALLGLVPEIKRFKNTYLPDITNVIVVTDGSDGTSMQSSSLSFNGALYMNKFSPRGVVDNNAAIYALLRDFYDVRIFHMDITDHVPDSMLSMDETKAFQRNNFLSKKDFGGADNVLWLRESLIQSKSTKVIDSLVNILA